MAASGLAKKLWVGVGSVFAIASLGWGTFQVTNLLAFDKQEFREGFTATEAADVANVDIDNETGSVEIIGTDREDILIEGEIFRGLQSPDHDERIVGDTLEIDASCFGAASFCSVNYDIQVPRDSAVKVRAAGGGIRVSNVTGPQDLDSSGGGVRVEGASGDLRLRASGGGIDAALLESTNVDADASGGGVTLQFVDAPRDVRAESSGGGVTIVLPDTPELYDVDASSSDSDVSRDIRSDPDSDRTIRARSSEGSVTVRYPNTP